MLQQILEQNSSLYMEFDVRILLAIVHLNGCYPCKMMLRERFSEARNPTVTFTGESLKSLKRLESRPRSRKRYTTHSLTEHSNTLEVPSFMPTFLLRP